MEKRLKGYTHSDALIVSGKVRIRPDKRELAVEAALRLAEESRKEEGCREFKVLSELSDPYTLFMFEVWEGVESMTRHFQTEHMAVFQEHMKKCALGEPDVKRYLVAA